LVMGLMKSWMIIGSPFETSQREWKCYPIKKDRQSHHQLLILDDQNLTVSHLTCTTLASMQLRVIACSSIERLHRFLILNKHVA